MGISDIFLRVHSYYCVIKKYNSVYEEGKN